MKKAIHRKEELWVKRRVFFVFFILSSVLLPAMSQNVKSESQKIEIGGVIIDQADEPLIGATVVEMGTGNGTVTNVEGKFTLTVLPNAKIKVSYVGYSSQILDVSGKRNFSIVLSDNDRNLDEVVVIGYGSARKKDLTGAIGTVSGDIIEQRNNSQLSTALQGTMPGVMVQRTNGAPGGNSSIKIRGITTIGDSDPLIIVDGVQFTNINDVNPADVESITVLKDAASAAIYGSRAASGVILITTKRGKAGRVSLNYTFEYGFNKPTSNPRYVGVTRFMEMENELRWNAIAYK